ncbi:MAG: ABC transporter ATP-binding protein [Actinomycetota bacterium]
MPLLELKNVSKVFAGRVRAVEDASLTLDEGRSLGIVGESGAGKTTLAQLSAGLLQATSGTVTADGQVIGKGNSSRTRKAFARMVQLVWQDAPGSFDPRMSIGRSLAEPLRIHGFASRAGVQGHVNKMLTEVGRKPEFAQRRPQGLSGGEVQRAAIARALATGPKLLVCDEPASALDVENKIAVVELIDRLRRDRGLSCMIITHDLALAGRLADELMVMYRGVFVESGPTTRVLKNPLHPYTRLLVNSQPVLGKPLSPHWGKSRKVRKETEAGDISNGGCRFLARCPDAIDRCAKSTPQLIEAGGGRQVACVLA